MKWNRFVGASLIALLIFATACSGDGTDKTASAELPLIKETDHGLFYSPDLPENVNRVITILSEAFESNYSRIAKLFDYELSDKTSIYVYTDKSEFQTMMGRATEGSYVASEKIIKVYTPANLDDPETREEYTDQIVHEFVHAVIQQINPSVGRVKWLDEGAAYYASNQLGKELQRRAVFFDLPTLEQLKSPDYFDEAGSAAYFYCGTFVQYMADTYGADALNRIVRNPKQIERILNNSFEKLYEQWKIQMSKPPSSL
ncbi:hypothetical protein ACFPVX_18885 [Cohnella faecalis]|uniref:Peptidase MA-like domain-containing protein n=1 Tax=Cohnella faecalis TaxID=2315694 RepID=A0A398CNI4_9BACL|nr:hypothetical protein [Cohnella faecalis]RIE01141.1 hypothetical protein D3H35_22290 [Cohnella faecalis]